MSKIWNDSIEKGRPERELKSRSNMWASELGGSQIDRFLKMRGTKPTNPPNPHSMRKFEAGNMMEWLVGLVLKRAGILIENQEWLSYQYPGLSEVTGKLDFFAGGQPDWEKAKEAVKSLELPDFFNRATDAIIAHFAQEYPNGLEKIVIEVKSCSSFMFDRYEKVGASQNHVLQTFHYLKSKNMEEGHIVYICKDDLRMLEVGVMNPSPVEDLYRGDIEAMSNFLRNDQQPELEKEVFFDKETGRFSKNWKVEYSNFLTMLYGYSEPEAYRMRWDSKVASFNRTLGRIVAGKNMTPLNKTVIEEMIAIFPNFDEFVAIAKEKGVKEENGEEAIVI